MQSYPGNDNRDKRDAVKGKGWECIMTWRNVEDVQSCWDKAHDSNSSLTCSIESFTKRQKNVLVEVGTFQNCLSWTTHDRSVPASWSLFSHIIYRSTTNILISILLFLSKSFLRLIFCPYIQTVIAEPLIPINLQFSLYESICLHSNHNLLTVSKYGTCLLYTSRCV